MLRPVIRSIGRTLFHMGGWGVLTLSTLDSSPLFLPFGNDLLVLALCARYRDRMFYYVAMATLGSDRLPRHGLDKPQRSERPEEVSARQAPRKHSHVRQG